MKLFFRQFLCIHNNVNNGVCVCVCVSLDCVIYTLSVEIKQGRKFKQYDMTLGQRNSGREVDTYVNFLPYKVKNSAHRACKQIMHHNYLPTRTLISSLHVVLYLKLQTHLTEDTSRPPALCVLPWCRVTPDVVYLLPFILCTLPDVSDNQR